MSIRVFVMKKSVKIILLLTACLLFSGCAKKAPNCNAKETKELVVQLAKEKYKEVVDGFGRSMIGPQYQSAPDMFKNVTFEVQNIRMTNYNDKTGSYECASDIRIVESGGKNLTVPVIYKSALLTDDKKKFHVTANFDFETAFANPIR
ncbi:MAG: hypothetical protein NTW44_00985 [Nitrospirae bacterium]|nr:hypothetical protein [Nitrospirota bacterium]